MAALTIGFSSGSAPSCAVDARAEGARLAQAPETGGDEEDEDDEDEVDIPPNLLENDSPFAADSSGARPDTSGFRPDTSATVKSLADSAKAFQADHPETLHSFPRSAGTLPASPTPGERPAAVPKTKPDRGPFGLSPFFLVLGLAAVHIFVVRTVGD